MDLGYPLLVDCLSKGVQTPQPFLDGLRLILPSKVKVPPPFTSMSHTTQVLPKELSFGMVEVQLYWLLMCVLVYATQMNHYGVTHWFAECGLCPMFRVYFAYAFHSLWTAEGSTLIKMVRDPPLM